MEATGTVLILLAMLLYLGLVLYVITTLDQNESRPPAVPF